MMMRSKMPDLLASYENGNARIRLYSDGTKVVETEENAFDYDFASSMDLCISKRCSHGCSFCYADCNPNGNFGRFDYPFLSTIHSGVEVAINLQLPLPDGLDGFLAQMRDQGVIVNVTVNQRDLAELGEHLKKLQKEGFVHGVGVSLVEVTDAFLKEMKEWEHAVIHIIAGITSVSDYSLLADQGLKILILGYKMKGRGRSWYSDDVTRRIAELRAALPDIMKGFVVVAFDNLALRQLDVKSILSEEEWEHCYMGEEATSSFYVDLCDGTFSPSSTDNRKFRIGDLDAEGMFQIVRMGVSNVSGKVEGVSPRLSSVEN